LFASGGLLEASSVRTDIVTYRVRRPPPPDRVVLVLTLVVRVMLVLELSWFPRWRALAVDSRLCTDSRDVWLP
jgi:hypothetical protein